MRVCPVCEGITDTELVRCPTCDVPMPRSEELALRETRRAAANPWLGVTIGGKYRIEGVLGKGGMGTVYRATHELSLAPAALKILHPRLAQQAESRGRLIAEAQRASRIRSDHVARILDVGESPDGSIFVAMELVEGRTLAELLAAHGALRSELVSSWLAEMAEALRVAHEAGVVHRDLSPSNVLVEWGASRARIKIVDFGIAVQHGDEDLQRGFADELWVKPPYTAPELLAHEEADARVDLFALGVIAYEMLTGRVPFAGGTLESRVQSVLEDEPGEWVTPGVPRRLRKLVMALLQKDPERRPPSAAAVLAELASLRRGPGRPLRIASLLFFGAALAFTVQGIGPSEPPYLVTGPGARIALTGTPPGPSVPARIVRVEEIERLPLQLGGLAGKQLQLSAFDGERMLFKEMLLRIEDDGRFELNVGRNAAWRRSVRALERRSGPSDLVFSAIAGRHERPLAWSRLRIDVESPRFEVCDFEPAKVLRMDSRVEVTAADDTGLRRVQFRLLEADGNVLASYEVLPESSQGLGARAISVPIGEVLQRKRVPGRLDVRLEVRLEDLAGRETVRVQSFDEADFAIPSIVDVRAPSGDDALTVSKGQADVLLRLNEVGEGRSLILNVALQSDGEPPMQLQSEIVDVARGPALLVRLAAPPFPTTEPLPFTFEIQDRVGNRSTTTRRLRFRNLDLVPRFQLVEANSLALLREGQLFTDGRAQRVEYRCNTAFTPSIQSDTQEDAPVRLLSSGPGQLSFEVLASSRIERHELRIEHVLSAQAQGVEIARSTTSLPLELLILPRPPELELPAVLGSGQLWSKRLLDDGLLEASAESYALGATLLPSPGPDSELRARLWRREGSAWQLRSGPEWLTLAQLREQRLEFLRGRNALAFEVRDVLGRGLLLRREDGDIVEPIQLAEPASTIVPFLDFRHDARPPQPIGEILVAFREPVIVRLEEDALFEDRDEIRLVPPALGAASPGYPGVIERSDGRTRVRVRLPFGDVARLCGWDAASSRDFAELAPEERGFIYRAPSGEFSIKIVFRPTRSLLRAIKLSSVLGADLPKALDLRLVPFRGLEGERTLRLGVEKRAPVPGTLMLGEPLEVGEIGDFFLGEEEVSRRAYAEFVRAMLTGPMDESSLATRARQLGHAEDPLRVQRFTRAGLLPDTSLFASGDFEVWVEAAPHRPVTGVNYFQAQAFARWLGQRVFGDADSFRLPFAAELEWAALGDRGEGARHGLRLTEEQLGGIAQRFRRQREALLRDGKMSAESWPPVPGELKLLGDYGLGLDGSRVYGLEFGVREWCEDVPISDEGSARDLFRSIAKSLVSHREFAVRRRLRQGADLERGFQRWLRLGVVRGLAWAEPARLAADPSEWLSSTELPPLQRVFGVKRSVQIARDGTGLSPGRISPLLRVVGFRIAGGRSFNERVRQKLR
jgi:formylglycine-generating enzyme required for sulfatase activity